MCILLAACRLGSITTIPPPTDLMLVDASQLLDHIMWPSSGIVGGVANGMTSRLVKHMSGDVRMSFLTDMTVLVQRIMKGKV